MQHARSGRGTRIRRIAVGALALGLVTSVSAGVATAQKKAKGDPIKIITIGEFDLAEGGTSNPEVSGAVEARAAAINKKGGLEDANGVKHEVEVIVCNTNNDPNRASQCARDGVEQGVVALIGKFTTFTGEVYPITEAESIPSIGGTPSEPLTLTSKFSFPITAGPIGLLYYMPRLLAEDGATKLSVVYPDLPAAAAAVPVIELSAGSTDATLENKVAVPLDAADLAPFVAASTENGADGIAAVIVGDAGAKYFVGLKQQGYDGGLATVSVFLTPNILENAGDALTDARIVNQLVPATAKKVPAVKQFVKDMNAFDEDLDKSDQALNNWASTWLFERVAKTLPEITPEALTEAMGQLEDYDMGGIMPPLTTTEEFVTPPGFPIQVPRMFNPTGVLATVKDGKVVRTSKKFVNLFGE